MKYFLISCLILLGCKEKKQKPEVAYVPPVKQHIIVASRYPRFVKNKCGQWAVQTHRSDSYTEGDQLGEIFYLGKPDEPHASWPDMEQYKFLRMVGARLGNEFQYGDSLTAVKEYKKIKAKIDSTYGQWAYDEKYSDSIYKCKHTYQ